MTKTGRALGIVDVLHSGSGDTILQINIAGSLEEGQQNGFIDFIAANGHMRWLKPGYDTLPSDRIKWLGELSDFAVVRPWLDAQVIFDEDKGNVGNTPWLTCRQCRRKEKGPLTSSMFFRAAKLTEKWPNAMILENSHTGGYPIAADPKLAPVNPSFPIRNTEWRGATVHHSCVDSFSEEARKPFLMEQAGKIAQRGNEIIDHYGSLRLALRAVQEEEMHKLNHLVSNAKQHLSMDSDLCGDISELHRICATPKYRGASPGSFRVRGLPRNPGEQEFMMSKLWKYAEERKCSRARRGGPHLPTSTVVRPPLPLLKNCRVTHSRAIRG